MADRLPHFIAPMLAKPGTPFDSDRHLFEVKWDGMRTLAFVEGGGYRLVNRQRHDVTDRYPEFAFLPDLPSGTVLDGEIVVLRDGKPDFELWLTREQARDRLRIEQLARTTPAVYVVFDLLHGNFASLLSTPLVDRRHGLEEIVAKCDRDRLALSDAIVGHGCRLFEEACKNELEGIIGKKLDSAYLPGRRTDAWKKIKRRQRLHCLILGWLPSEKTDNDFQSLVIATDTDGVLRYVGRVGSGFGADLRRQLNELLRERSCSEPLVPCDLPALWVEPGLYCTVSFLERTHAGLLRAPVFEELIVE